MKAGFNALLSSLFDDEFYLDRYATFKSASAGFLLLTLFTQNCTQLRLLVLAKNRDDYVGKSPYYLPVNVSTTEPNYSIHSFDKNLLGQI